MVNQDKVVNCSIEFWNSLNISDVFSFFILKIGVKIILIRNINPPRLYNGIRLSVKKTMNNVIEATTLTATLKGENVLLPLNPMITTDIFAVPGAIHFRND